MDREHFEKLLKNTKAGESFAVQDQDVSLLKDVAKSLKVDIRCLSGDHPWLTSFEIVSVPSLKKKRTSRKKKEERITALVDELEGAAIRVGSLMERGNSSDIAEANAEVEKAKKSLLREILPKAKGN